MFGMMYGTRVEAISSGGIAWKDVIETGVRGDKPDVNTLASTKKNEATVMIWNYHDDDRSAPDAQIEVVLNGIPAKNVKIIQYMIDKHNSNSYEVWKTMGSPQNPTAGQYSILEKAGQLQPVGVPESMIIKKGSLVLRKVLPRQGIALLVIKWD